MPRSDWRRPELAPLEEGKRRIKLVVSYHGSHYSGWQRQVNARSVAEVLEACVNQMIGETVEIVGSGRTDSGVHAFGQVCHMDITNQKVKSEAFLPALNRLLPPDIRILSSTQVDGTFHARYTTMARLYRYYIKREAEMTPFDEKQVAKVKQFPPLELLQGYARQIQGTHDFTTFTASGDLCPSKWRDIYESYWAYETDRWGHQVLTYTICGNAFLYKMVRSLVGTMLEFAQEGRPVQDFGQALIALDRKKAGRTAAAWGLYLYRVSYDPTEYAWFEEERDE